MATRSISIDLRMLYFSGIGTYLQNLVPIIIQELPDFHFYLLGKMEELKRIPEFHSPKVNRIDCRSPIYSVSEQYELIRKIPRTSTLFWSPHYNIPVFYKGPMFVTIHDLFPLAMPDYLYGLHKKVYAKFMFKALLRKASVICCVSEFTKKELYRLTEHQKENVFVVHNGIGGDWFRVIKEDNPHPHPYILYVGNVKPHKNLGRLIHAFKQIKAVIPHDLVIVGKKEGFITGDESVFDLLSDVSDRVYFTGYIADRVLKQYYAHADALVFVSLYEGFGFPPLEAMACGCPTVVSSAASLSEVCGQAALYCNPLDSNDIADKIILILNDAALREKLRGQGVEQARRFTWEQSATKMIDLIINFFKHKNVSIF